jgi:hypothetical protein
MFSMTRALSTAVTAAKTPMIRPLVLNADSTNLDDDAFYDFLLHYLPKSARIYVSPARRLYVID